jgi:hypothetical protein
MKNWRKEKFTNYANKVKGLEGTVILVPCKNNDEYRVVEKIDVLENFYHTINIENDCSNAKKFNWLVEKLEAITNFDELENLIDEEVDSRNGCDGTPILSYIERNEDAILRYLRAYETGNENLNISDFLEMNEEEYGIAYDEITKELLNLLK